MMKCEHCPVTSGTCLGETGDRPHFCEWAATGDRSKLGLIVDRSALPLAPPPALPGLLTKAVNFASAVAGHVAAGLPTLDAPGAAARLAVCHAPCPDFVAPNSCAVCGCNLAVKASWADQDCPRGLWPAATEPVRL